MASERPPEGGHAAVEAALLPPAHIQPRCPTSSSLVTQPAPSFATPTHIQLWWLCRRHAFSLPARGGYARSFVPAGLPRAAHGFTRIDNGCSQEEDLEDEDPQSAGIGIGSSKYLHAARARSAMPRRFLTSCARTAVGTAAVAPSKSSSSMSGPIAVDAMGGDHAPDEIIAGARRAADELGVDVVLVGRGADISDTLGLELVEASEVIAMSDDGAKGVRTKKDSSLVRGSEMVRDGAASAFVVGRKTLGRRLRPRPVEDGQDQGRVSPRCCNSHPGSWRRADGATRFRSDGRLSAELVGAVRTDGCCVREDPVWC